ncbi:MAG: stage 0 sporulation family protein [Armatimonadetes bacterium]|nr:stage 0 sporulation family protein [Armatimonadota bacterium]
MSRPVVGVSFHNVGKIHYYDPGSLHISEGDPVVAETFRGVELGRVVQGPLSISMGKDGGRPPVLLRKASKGDLGTSYRNRLRAAEAFRIAERKVKDHGLPMKLLDAEYTLDGNRIVIYFSAEGRVDFRQLVRDLASSLRKRIELHQVGARDRAKLTGGTGPCGRECCCSSWLRAFSPVSIKMTKEQGLSLNPAKISGSCGRLMCCLRYEYETYRKLRQELPPVGSEVRLPEGKARVIDVHLLRRTLTVEHPTLGIFEVPAGRSLVEDQAQLCQSCGVSACGPEEEEEEEFS